jgi:hypothetical protein
MSWGIQAMVLVALFILIWQLDVIHDTLKTIRDSLRKIENKSS